MANLAAAGVVIPGELVVAAGAYFYERSALRPPAEAVEPPWRGVHREIRRLLARHVLPNTSFSVHTDFAEPGAQVTLDAQLPALYLDGPSLRENRIWTANEFVDTVLEGGRGERRQPHLVVDFSYRLVGLSDSVAEVTSLLLATAELFERTPWLEVDDPATGVRHRFPLEVTEQPRMQAALSDANLRSFTAELEVIGVPVVSSEPEGWHAPVDALLADVQRGLGADALPETVSIT